MEHVAPAMTAPAKLAEITAAEARVEELRRALAAEDAAPRASRRRFRALVIVAVLGAAGGGYVWGRHDSAKVGIEARANDAAEHRESMDRLRGETGICELVRAPVESAIVTCRHDVATLPRLTRRRATEETP